MSADLLKRGAVYSISGRDWCSSIYKYFKINVEKDFSSKYVFALRARKFTNDQKHFHGAVVNIFLRLRFPGWLAIHIAKLVNLE